MAFQHISQSLAAAAYEEADKLCRVCGQPFRGYHWTKPPCASLRREYVMDGRVLGICGPCISEGERHQQAIEDAQNRERQREVANLSRPRRTADVPF